MAVEDNTDRFKSLREAVERLRIVRDKRDRATTYSDRYKIELAVVRAERGVVIEALDVFPRKVKP